FGLTQIEFGIIWRYFAWSNQTLAMIVLWTVTAYLIYEGRAYWVSLFPALFMTMVCTTYILIAPEGFGLPNRMAYLLGAAATLLISLAFWRYVSLRGLMVDGPARP